MGNPQPFYGFSRAGYLQACCNRFGDLKVSRAVMKGGTLFWSKHFSVLELWHSEAGINFLSTVNNRTLFPSEVVIDLDTPESISDVAFICSRLDSLDLSYRCFYSGSRGFHIHMTFPELLLHPERKKEIRESLINEFSGDLMKISDGAMITLEWAENNKTGKIKTFYRGDCSCLIN